VYILVAGIRVCACVFIGEHKRACLHPRFAKCSERILEGVIEATVGTSRRRMIKARSQPVPRDAAVLVHGRQTHREAEQRSRVDVGLFVCLENQRGCQSVRQAERPPVRQPRNDPTDDTGSLVPRLLSLVFLLY